MNFDDLKSKSDHEEYYLKIIDLQEKLRKSEEQRIKLEAKFNELYRNKREMQHSQVQFIKNKYNEFVEQDRIRHERNENILRALDRIEYRAAMLTAKTDRLRMMRKNYELLLMQSYSRYKLNKQQASELNGNSQLHLPSPNSTQFEIPKINLFQPSNSDIYDTKVSKQNNSNSRLTNIYDSFHKGKIKCEPFPTSSLENSRIAYGIRTNSNDSLISENSDGDEFTPLSAKIKRKTSRMGVSSHENPNTLYPPEIDTQFYSTISPTEKTVSSKTQNRELNKSDDNDHLNKFAPTFNTMPDFIHQSKQAKPISTLIHEQEALSKDKDQVQDVQNISIADLSKNKIQTKSYEPVEPQDQLNDSIKTLQKDSFDDLEMKRNSMMNHDLNLSQNFKNKLDLNTNGINGKLSEENRLDGQELREHENFNEIDESQNVQYENQPIDNYNQNKVESDSHNYLPENHEYQSNEGTEQLLSDNNYVESSEKLEYNQENQQDFPYNDQYENLDQTYAQGELQENYSEEHNNPNYEYNENIPIQENVNSPQNNYTEEDVTNYQQEDPNYDAQLQPGDNADFYGEKIEDNENTGIYETNYDYDGQVLNQEDNEQYMNNQQENYQETEYADVDRTVPNEEYETNNQAYEQSDQVYESQNQEYENQNQEYDNQNVEYENVEYQSQNQEQENYNYQEMNDGNQGVQDDYNNYEYSQNNNQLPENQYENYDYQQTGEQVAQQDFNNYDYETQNQDYENNYGEQTEYVQDSNVAYNPEYEQNSEQQYGNLDNQYQNSDNKTSNNFPTENALGDIVTDYEENETVVDRKLPNLAQMLDSDTESFQQSERQTSLKDESDFDFSSGTNK